MNNTKRFYELPKKMKVTALLVTFFALIPVSVKANVKLPTIFTDNMVLQRDVKVPVWGWADQGEKVKVTFAGKSYSGMPDTNGKWIVYLDPQAAGSSSYEMTVKGKNKLTLKNIVMGEVWICSGQSNMDFTMNEVRDSKEEIAAANYPNIRLFIVPKKMAEKLVTEMQPGSWQVCSTQTVANFSAVGYFFGRNLNKELNVPIGLIHDAWGGTVAETWMSAEAANSIPDFKKPMQQLSKIGADGIKGEMEAQIKRWDYLVANEEEGVKNKWFLENTDVSSWKIMSMPKSFEEAGLSGLDGVVWFRKEIVLTEAETKAGITLSLGRIDDADVSYVNGKQVGATDSYIAGRNYKVEPSVLKAGKNVIVVKVIDMGANGGFCGGPDDLAYTSVSGKHTLVGDWNYQIGVDPGSRPATFITPNIFPTLLYNGMINPLLPLAIKGAIWYQGESNASLAFQYQTVFPALITDWRKQFNNPNMPFLFVQLANYMKAENQPAESEWAELRDAQLKTLSLPNTGMAVITDIGDANNIHPKNKQDVGYRLSLPALNNVYHKTVEYSGPIFKSQTIEGRKVRLKFDHVGKGLTTTNKYGYVNGFAIAGADKKFVWAKAFVSGNDVIVFSEKVDQPVAVRYGWANNPDDANLYNIDGLPASPFRTDSWKGITDK